MGAPEVVDVVWRLALSGTSGRLAACPRDATLGQLAALLGLGQLCVLACAGDDRGCTGHAERPFLGLAKDAAEAAVDLVVLAAAWQNPLGRLRWRDVALSPEGARDHGLLRALIALSEGDDSTPLDGVRGSTRVEGDVGFCVDETFLFVRLQRWFDVWFAYLGGLAVDGAPVEPRSVWLYADLHTPLQPVEVGRDFELPIVAAQYAEIHLCFELDALPLQLPPGRVAFDARVALVRSEARQTMALSDHVSPRGWALAGGVVAYSLPAPAFLQASISVVDHDFQVPAPQAYDYALDADAASEAAFVGVEGRDFSFHEGGWHRATNVFCGLAVARRGPVRAPWRFTLRARRRS